MTFSWYTRVLLALASGVTLALAFPNYNLPLLAWVSIALLVLASYGARPRVAPLYGFLHGLVFYPICLPWMDIVMRQYGDVGRWTSAGILGLVGIAGGIICAVFSWGVALASRKGPILACALAPFLWVTLEFLRGNLPIIAFPWNLIGYAASGNLALVQLTAITGIYGLSFVVAGYGALLAYAILSGRHRAWQSVIAATAVLILIAVGGRFFVPSATPHYVAHLVQTDFAQSYSYPPNWMRIHARDLDRLEQISIDSARDIPGVIVWPEVPAPFSLQDPDFAGRAQQIARESGQDFLVGVEDWKHNAGGKWIATNSSVLLDPSGQRVFTYDKIYLVPFGEYVPLRKWLTFAGKLTADIGDFTPGTEYRVGEFPGGTFSVFICYEGVLPGAVRHFTANGAELLINVSNDDGRPLGRSRAARDDGARASRRKSPLAPARHQQWIHGRCRPLWPHRRGTADRHPRPLDAPYDFRTGLTLYARFGNWLAWLCVLASLALLVASLVAGSFPPQSARNSKDL